jgi:ComF family protein
MELLARVISGFLDALAPPSCAACDAPSGHTFCDACGAISAATVTAELDGVPLLVVGEYAPPLSTAITRFKYSGRAELSRCLARLLVPAIERLGLPRGTVLVPVPLHARRLATRGYNQAALLAQDLAHGSRLACDPRLLRRVRETERQVGKSRAERLTNASGAFELRRGSRSADLVLVDDVVTTGSTVRACAQALAEGGANLLGVVALARAHPTSAEGKPRGMTASGLTR